MTVWLYWGLKIFKHIIYISSILYLNLSSIIIMNFHNLYKDDVENKYFISRNTNIAAVLYFISLCRGWCSSKFRQHIGILISK